MVDVLIGVGAASGALAAAPTLRQAEENKMGHTSGYLQQQCSEATLEASATEVRYSYAEATPNTSKSEKSVLLEKRL
jgi:hypothetical protein